MRRRWFVILWIVAWGAWCPSSGVADLLPTQQYTTVTKTATSTTAQSATTLWTPATGFAFVLQGCLVSSQNAVQVRLQVSSVDVVPPIYLESYGSQMVGGANAPIYTSDVNAVLTYTTVSHAGAYKNVSVMCWGWEQLP